MLSGVVAASADPPPYPPCATVSTLCQRFSRELTSAAPPPPPSSRQHHRCRATTTAPQHRDRRRRHAATTAPRPSPRGNRLTPQVATAHHRHAATAAAPRPPWPPRDHRPRPRVATAPHHIPLHRCATPGSTQQRCSTFLHPMQSPRPPSPTHQHPSGFPTTAPKSRPPSTDPVPSVLGNTTSSPVEVLCGHTYPHHPIDIVHMFDHRRNLYL